MRDGGRDTGGRVNRRFRWFENPSPRPHSASHSQPRGGELSPDFAKALTSSGLLRSLERHFTIGRRGVRIGESRDPVLDTYRGQWNGIGDIAVRPNPLALMTSSVTAAISPHLAENSWCLLPEHHFTDNLKQRGLLRLFFTYSLDVREHVPIEACASRDALRDIANERGVPQPCGPTDKPAGNRCRADVVQSPP